MAWFGIRPAEANHPRFFNAMEVVSMKKFCAFVMLLTVTGLNIGCTESKPPAPAAPAAPAKSDDKAKTPDAAPAKTTDAK